MRAGEKGILAVAVLSVVILAGIRFFWGSGDTESDGTKFDGTEFDGGIPFYSTASNELKVAGSDSYRQRGCKSCHSLWSVRDLTANVPAPKLDGIGSLRDEEWFYAYFSAESPQAILPSRLKKKYQMPSYAYLPEQERKLLAAYMSSLKVEDWYLEETKKAEYEKLTGKTYVPVAQVSNELPHDSKSQKQIP